MGDISRNYPYLYHAQLFGILRVGGRWRGGPSWNWKSKGRGGTYDWNSEGMGGGGSSGDRQDCERTNKMTHC